MKAVDSVLAAARRGAGLVVTVGLASGVIGCGGEQAARSIPRIAPPPGAAAPAPSPAAAPAAEAGASVTVTVGETTATFTPGQAPPQALTDLMFQFEGRFGRPPTNYAELNRLNQPAPRPGSR